jgi:hypothetical protein
MNKIPRPDPSPDPDQLSPEATSLNLLLPDPRPRSSGRQSVCGPSSITNGIARHDPAELEPKGLGVAQNTR